MHPGALVEPSRSRGIVTVDAEADPPVAAAVELAERVPEQSEAEAALTPWLTDAEHPHEATTAPICVAAAHGRHLVAGADEEAERRVEVRNLDELKVAIDSGADVVLLDNFTAEQTRQAVEITRGRVPLESSGGITLETVRSFAETGVDYISVGALTHSVPAVDIHLRVTPE